MKQNLHIIISFEATDGPFAPEGPGWYVHVTRPRAPEVDHDLSVEEILPHVRLDNKDVPKLAKVIDTFAKGKPLNWTPHCGRGDISLEQAVNEATQAGGAIIRQQVAEAEQAVLKLAELKARAEEFSVPDE